MESIDVRILNVAFIQTSLATAQDSKNKESRNKEVIITINSMASCTCKCMNFFISFIFVSMSNAGASGKSRRFRSETLLDRMNDVLVNMEYLSHLSDIFKDHILSPQFQSYCQTYVDYIQCFAELEVGKQFDALFQKYKNTTIFGLITGVTNPLTGRPMSPVSLMRLVSANKDYRSTGVIPESDICERSSILNGIAPPAIRLNYHQKDDDGHSVSGTSIRSGTEMKLNGTKGGRQGIEAVLGPTPQDLEDRKNQLDTIRRTLAWKYAEVILKTALSCDSPSEMAASMGSFSVDIFEKNGERGFGHFDVDNENSNKLANQNGKSVTNSSIIMELMGDDNKNSLSDTKGAFTSRFREEKKNSKVLIGNNMNEAKSKLSNKPGNILNSSLRERARSRSLTSCMSRIQSEQRVIEATIFFLTRLLRSFVTESRLWSACDAETHRIIRGSEFNFVNHKIILQRENTSSANASSSILNDFKNKTTLSNLEKVDNLVSSSTRSSARQTNTNEVTYQNATNNNNPLTKLNEQEVEIVRQVPPTRDILKIPEISTVQAANEEALNAVKATCWLRHKSSTQRGNRCSPLISIVVPTPHERATEIADRVISPRAFERQVGSHAIANNSSVRLKNCLDARGFKVGERTASSEISRELIRLAKMPFGSPARAIVIPAMEGDIETAHALMCELGVEKTIVDATMTSMASHLEKRARIAAEKEAAEMLKMQLNEATINPMNNGDDDDTQSAAGSEISQGGISVNDAIENGNDLHTLTDKDAKSHHTTASKPIIFGGKLSTSLDHKDIFDEDDEANDKFKDYTEPDLLKPKVNMLHEQELIVNVLKQEPPPLIVDVAMKEIEELRKKRNEIAEKFNQFENSKQKRKSNQENKTSNHQQTLNRKASLMRGFTKLQEWQSGNQLMTIICPTSRPPRDFNSTTTPRPISQASSNGLPSISPPQFTSPNSQNTRQSNSYVIPDEFEPSRTPSFRQGIRRSPPSLRRPPIQQPKRTQEGSAPLSLKSFLNLKRHTHFKVFSSSNLNKSEKKISNHLDKENLTTVCDEGQNQSPEFLPKQSSSPLPQSVRVTNEDKNGFNRKVKYVKSNLWHLMQQTIRADGSNNNYEDNNKLVAETENDNKTKDTDFYIPF